MATAIAQVISWAAIWLIAGAGTTRADSRVEAPAEWRVELKRQFTERGTWEETSRTIIRLESLPGQYLSLVRLDIPFVDKKNYDPSSARLGDIKLRLSSLRHEFAGARANLIFETTFPTAQATALGGGKYQVSPGFETRLKFWESPGEMSPTWVVGLKQTAQEVVSVAGGDHRKDINYAKLEEEFEAVRRGKLLLRLTPKVLVDWGQTGKCGAVLELELGWTFNRRWRTTLVVGQGLWNTYLPTMYGRKSEWTLRFTF